MSDDDADEQLGPFPELGKLIMQRREAARLSQQDLALRAGLSSATVSRIERGAISPRALARLCEVRELGLQPEDLPPGMPEEDESAASDQARVAEPNFLLGKQIRIRREAAGLSRAKLAKKARLSEATIKLMESRGQVSRRGFLLLCKVKELGFSPADFGSEEPLDDFLGVSPDARAPARVPISPLNAYLAPAVDVLSLHQQQRHALQGRGGVLPPFTVYLEPASVEDYRRWYDLTWRRFESRNALCSLLPVLLAVLRKGRRRLDLISLGCGFGESETNLTQLLALGDEALDVDVSLCLVDLSLPLLSAAVRKAHYLLGANPEVRCWGVHADMEQLGPQRDILYDPRRRRLFTLLGGTLGEVDSESRLLRQSIASVAEPGDLFLFDVDLAAASSPMPSALWARFTAWQLGVVRRAQPDLRGLELDLVQTPPTGWATKEHELVASGQAPDGTARRWTLGRSRRYSTDHLSRQLEGCGWRVLHVLRFGDRDPAALVLCERADATRRDAEVASTLPLPLFSDRSPA
ncbi:MAG: L-histidine N(alpha)-methyltransferase [Polyangia bacterium]